MDIYQLLDKLGGEIVSNKAIVRIDDEPIEIGGVVGNEFQLNEAGIALAAKHSSDTSPSKKPASTKRKRARNEDGTLKADDPSTPNINEAWEHGDD